MLRAEAKRKFRWRSSWEQREVLIISRVGVFYGVLLFGHVADLHDTEDWPTELANLLNRATDGTGKIDTVIDSGGGEQLMTQVGKILKNGGRVVCYGM